MKIVNDLRALDRDQRAAFVASMLGWTLDAFDYFLMAFLVAPIAEYFHVDQVDVFLAITLTLAFRPLGALVFGRLADHYGRRPMLMASIVAFSLFSAASAFAPNLTMLLILRALFGFAMGGEWGIGSSLAMETIPPGSRGAVSGILQEGYPLGFLLASVVYGLFYGVIGWRGMFLVGVLPALVVVYIRSGVKESPAWVEHRARVGRSDLRVIFRRHWQMFLYVTLLMTAFTWFSHGTQDVYPTFLKTQHQLPHLTVGTIAVIANIGAIVGGVTFGAWSQRIGRRRAIIIATLLALPVIPLWAYATTPFWLAVGAFLIQFGVQGAWGVIPAHLNELSPPEVRGTFPGLTYQFGNLLAASCATLQGSIARAHGGNYSYALASVTALAALAILVLALVGKENREANFRAVTPS